MCAFKGCYIKPSYGYPNGPPLYCAVHKDSEMVNRVVLQK